MPGLFLSHSSEDKNFIEKLAIDLVSKEFPVWFDSYEIDPGDSLFKRIYEGIDDSTYLLIALSPNSLSSTWVKRELNEALAKEEKLGRKFVIPIKIIECDAPPSIGDRIYADFTGPYGESLDKLETYLRSLKVHEISVPANQKLFPLVFSKGIYLKRNSLKRPVETFYHHYKKGELVETNQIIVAPDSDYTEIRNVISNVLYNIVSYQGYSPDLEDRFEQIYDSVRKHEDALRKGNAEIINGLFSITRCDMTCDACHWYSRIIRSTILARLRSAPTRHLLYGNGPSHPPMLGSTDAAAFFGVKGVYLCDVWRGDRRSKEYTKIWIDSDSYEGKSLWQMQQRQINLSNFTTFDFLVKYFIPQMVYRHFFTEPPSLLTWKFDALKIGIT